MKRSADALATETPNCILLGSCLRRFCSRLNRQTCLLPRGPTSSEGARFLPPGLSEFLRHTGARRFASSSTVGDEPCLLFEIEFLRPLCYVVGWHPHRSAHLRVALFKATLGAHVEDHDRFLCLPQTV